MSSGKYDAIIIQGTSPIVPLRRRTTTRSPGRISSFSATLTEAGDFSTTCLDVSASALALLTSGRTVDVLCTAGCDVTLDSSAVNGLAGSVTKVPSPCLVTTRP